MSKLSEGTGMRPAQVMAAALAAVTAAFVGSRLGVYGTVIGAGVISLATTIGGEIYLRSLDRTKEAAKRTKDAALARAVRTAATWPVAEVTAPGDSVDDNAETAEAGADETRELTAPEEEPVRKRPRWLVLAGGALVAFVLGMGVVTGIELITGNSLSGEDGRSVSNFLGGPARQEPAPEQQPVVPDEDPSTPPSSESSTPSSSTSSGPTSTPSETTEPPETTDSSKPPVTTTEPEPDPSEPADILPPE